MNSSTLEKIQFLNKITTDAAGSRFSIPVDWQNVSENAQEIEPEAKSSFGERMQIKCDEEAKICADLSHSESLIEGERRIKMRELNYLKAVDTIHKKIVAHKALARTLNGDELKQHNQSLQKLESEEGHALVALAFANYSKVCFLYHKALMGECDIDKWYKALSSALITFVRGVEKFIGESDLVFEEKFLHSVCDHLDNINIIKTISKLNDPLVKVINIFREKLTFINTCVKFYLQSNSLVGTQLTLGARLAIMQLKKAALLNTKAQLEEYSEEDQIQLYTNALAEYPILIDAIYNRAYLFYKQKLFSKVIEEMTDLLKFAQPYYSYYLRAIAYYHLARQTEKKENFQLARQDILEGMEKDEGVEDYRGLGRDLQFGCFHSCESFLNTVESLPEPKQGVDARLNLFREARACIKKGDYINAEISIRKYIDHTGYTYLNGHLYLDLALIIYKNLGKAAKSDYMIVFDWLRRVHLLNDTEKENEKLKHHWLSALFHLALGLQEESEKAYEAAIESLKKLTTSLPFEADKDLIRTNMVTINSCLKNHYHITELFSKENLLGIPRQGIDRLIIVMRIIYTVEKRFYQEHGFPAQIEEKKLEDPTIQPEKKNEDELEDAAAKPTKKKLKPKKEAIPFHKKSKKQAAGLFALAQAPLVDPFVEKLCETAAAKETSAAARNVLETMPVHSDGSEQESKSKKSSRRAAQRTKKEAVHVPYQVPEFKTKLVLPPTPLRVPEPRPIFVPAPRGWSKVVSGEEARVKKMIHDIELKHDQDSEKMSLASEDAKQAAVWASMESKIDPYKRKYEIELDADTSLLVWSLNQIQPTVVVGGQMRDALIGKGNYDRDILSGAGLAECSSVKIVGQVDTKPTEQENLFDLVLQSPKFGSSKKPIQILQRDEFRKDSKCENPVLFDSQRRDYTFNLLWGRLIKFNQTTGKNRWVIYCFDEQSIIDAVENVLRLAKKIDETTPLEINDFRIVLRGLDYATRGSTVLKETEESWRIVLRWFNLSRLDSLEEKAAHAEACKINSTFRRLLSNSNNNRIAAKNLTKLVDYDIFEKIYPRLHAVLKKDPSLLTYLYEFILIRDKDQRKLSHLYALFMVVANEFYLHMPEQVALLRLGINDQIKQHKLLYAEKGVSGCVNSIWHEWCTFVNRKKSLEARMREQQQTISVMPLTKFAPVNVVPPAVNIEVAAALLTATPS